ncbi:N-acetylgalactosamine 6-sulfatase (GALNS) [Colwellia sp. 75C3]|uniref:YHYH protein n=1 Tax=Colwellia sp. 75C3 TaxID=888425 RepID=UPI000C32F0A6|nr:YHYH protein [Colwellia sp. 75C3]PKG83175.1 N-acetylgalactosamine 6-sulfatase (GALNS) [Colwellia sp. 75C3]
MLNTLRFLILSTLFVILASCGGGSTEEAEDPIVIPVGIPVEAPIESPIEPPAEDDNALVQPNILFIISDDQGLDASAQYDFSDDVPQTPTLNMLAQQGITFENMWVTPACSTTRSTIITGKYGINNGVESLPGNLSAEHEILQQYLKGNATSDNYQSAVFGKWHIGGTSATHPNDIGVDYYAGNIGNLSDYYDWSLTINGVVENSTEYHSTKITDLALNWVSEQTAPWFAWVAYSAPHSPFHLPPTSLHSRDLSGISTDIINNKRDYYLAAIEAMDTEIGRLLDTLDKDTRNNTIIIFIGDNGTPKAVIDTAAYSATHSKFSLYQGGVATPFVVSGKGVSRINERETALVTATDLYATIANVAGVTDTKIHDSQSFKSLFSEQGIYERSYVYTAYKSEAVTGWTTRSDNYKLIEFDDGIQEFYSLQDGFSESENLLPTSDYVLLEAIRNLESFATVTQGDVSEVTEGAIDITNAILESKSQNCLDYIEQFTSTVNDINKGLVFQGDLVISQIGDKCVFNTNAIPNHDFNDGGSAFPNNVSEQNDQFEITVSPTKASQFTPLSLQVDNAILLNGVKVDLLAAGCYGIGNGKVGCNDMAQAWRYDPMHEANGFAVDSHNAHAQPDGTYHYHGSPLALFDDTDNQESPVVGFAADGFPIFGSNFNDEGTIRQAQSSYRLKSGNRPNGEGDPGGSYDGKYRDDYEYVEGLGDLDECNGMTKDSAYGYYITQSYPYVLACFSGTPDNSFTK